MEREYTVQTGMDVVGSDGDKVGKIVEVHASYIVVEKGFFFPKDHFIPTSAVGQVGADDKVYLTVTKDQALEQGWDNPPATNDETAVGYADDATHATDGSRSAAGQDAVSTPTGAQFTDTSYGGDPAYRDADLNRDTTAQADSDVIGSGYTADTDIAASGPDVVRVPVHEETLTPVTREVDRGSVRIEKEVIEEDRVVDVPLVEERIRVSRVEGTGGAPIEGDTAFESGSIDIPLRGEEVVLERTTQTVGEVVVEKEKVQRTERASGTVRREEVRVDDQTGDVGDDRGATS